jgi:catechol 2,3-dioxygenase-like lactoylglutathione lyase family enzyme
MPQRPVHLRSSVPALPVGDVDATAAWYERELGFRTAGIFPAEPPSAWASLQRDNAEIMLQRIEGFTRPASVPNGEGRVWHLYIRMSGVHTLYDSVRDRPFVTMSLRRQPYGDWEFEVQDINGYLIVFGGDEHIGEDL